MRIQHPGSGGIGPTPDRLHLGLSGDEGECPPVAVFADPLIEKVFFNLVENSVRHGEKTADIRISFRDLGEGGSSSSKTTGSELPPI